MIIHEFINPIPCTTPLGDGYVWYVKSNGIFENDELTVILLDGGEIRHFEITQVQVWYNATYGINKKVKPNPNDRKNSKPRGRDTNNKKRRDTSCRVY